MAISTRSYTFSRGPVAFHPVRNLKSLFRRHLFPAPPGTRPLGARTAANTLLERANQRVEAIAFFYKFFNNVTKIHAPSQFSS